MTAVWPVTLGSSCWYETMQLQTHSLFPFSYFWKTKQNQNKKPPAVLLVHRKKLGSTGTYLADSVMVEQLWKNIPKIYYHLANLENTILLVTNNCHARVQLLSARILRWYMKHCTSKTRVPTWTSYNPKVIPQSLGKEMMNIQVSHSPAPQISCYEHL